MNYRLLSFLLAGVCVVLMINIYRMNTVKQEPADCGHAKEIETLNFEKQEWIKRENVFLEQNAFLVNQNNELKQQLNRKPQIIYRDVQTQTIDVDASESYINALEQRYSPNH